MTDNINQPEAPPPAGSDEAQPSRAFFCVSESLRLPSRCAPLGSRQSGTPGDRASACGDDDTFPMSQPLANRRALAALIQF